jgi:alpha-1,6-mannosyltransferase
LISPPDSREYPARAEPLAGVRGFDSAKLPALTRTDPSLSVLDISEYYSDSSGGVRTYLEAKHAYVAARPSLRRTMVVPGEMDAVWDEPGNRTYRLRGPAIPFHSYRFLLATRSVARIIAHEQPDVVEIGSAYFVPWVVSRARRRNSARVAWFYHSNLPRLAAPSMNQRRGSGALVVRSLGTYVQRLGRLADITLAASDSAANDLRAWGVENVERTSLGVDLSRFHPSRRAEREAVRAQLGITCGPLVGFVGRLAAEKQVDALLRAWPAVERRTGGTLVLVGHGPQEGRLRALAANQRVLFLPHERNRDRLANFLAALDLYVSPAPYETFGLAVCEALASGVPVVAVNQGGAAELVRNSAAGMLAELGDAAGLAEAMLTTLSAQRGPLSAQARRYVEAHHSWRDVLTQLFDIYRRLRR